MICRKIKIRKHLSFQPSYTSDDRMFHFKYLTWKEQSKNLLYGHMDEYLSKRKSKGGVGKGEEKQRKFIHCFFQDLQKVSKDINEIKTTYSFKSVKTGQTRHLPLTPFFLSHPQDPDNPALAPAAQ